MNRYHRHIILPEIGEAGQHRLATARVLVIGAGGLGCPALQYLAAAGVGTLGIVDFDAVDESNLNRQILFGVASLGQNKAAAAAARLRDLNPTVDFNVYPKKLTYANALQWFGDYDIIVDGTDNFATRYSINDAAVMTGKPLVYGAIHKFEGQLSVFNYNNGPDYRCLFPKPPKEHMPNCAEIGVLGVLPGIIGIWQANEVLKVVLGIGTVLSGKVLCYNALTAQTNTFMIEPSHQSVQAIAAQRSHTTPSPAHPGPTVISIETALQKQDAQFIDVRECDEQPRLSRLNPLCIPLHQLERSLDKIDLEKEKIFFCQSGVRSKKAVSILLQHHITNSYSLREDALAIEQKLQHTKLA